MSALSKQLENCYPDWDWWKDSFDCFVEELSAKGIEIIQEKRGQRKDGTAIWCPAISFSGFCSQGDGLAFECSIQWLKFFEAHPSFKEQLLEWYLLLSANPDYFNVGTRRYSRDDNCMEAWCDDDFPDVVEHGFFAGADMFDDVPDLSARRMQDWILKACEEEASRMYKALEEEYNWLCENEKERRCEDFIEENREVLAACIAAILLDGGEEISFAEGAVQEVVWEASEGGISCDDLETLDLIEYIKGAGWRVSAKGKELLCNSNDSQAAICSNEPNTPCGERGIA